MEQELLLLQAKVDAAKSALDAISSKLHKQFSDYQEEEAQFKRGLNLKPSEWKGRVKLDVGGVKFFTTQADLQSKKGFSPRFFFSLKVAFCFRLLSVSVRRTH